MGRYRGREGERERGSEGESQKEPDEHMIPGDEKRGGK